MLRRLLFVFALVVLLVLSLQCSTDLPTSPTRGENEVWIENSRFVPQTLTVSKGTTVTWTNKDNIQNGHTVDAGSPMNPSDVINLHLGLTDEGDSRGFTFNATGTFPYYCLLHGETGTIVVQ